MNSITFLTFGNEKFKNSLSRIQNEARQLPFDNIIGYNETQLKEISEFWDRNGLFVTSNKRGYGYWLWKSFLTLYTLRSMNEGDILVYADAGCTIHPNIDEFNKDIQILKNSKNEIISWSTFHIEKTWCKMDLIDYMNAKNLLDENQFHSTFFMIRCTPRTISIVKRWYEIGCNYHMIDDSESYMKNDSTFTEHRHDQSIFSILRHIYGTDIHMKPSEYIEDTRIQK